MSGQPSLAVTIGPTAEGSADPRLPFPHRLIADCAEAAGPAYDEIAVWLSCSAPLLARWNNAPDAAPHPDPVVRAREQQDLDWWIQQARLTFNAGIAVKSEVWGLIT
jgi:hypothetical protein